MSIHDVAVIGAGSFGAWTALRLQREGRRVALVDAYGPGNSRASSGGESRIIRMGYGAAEIYTRFSLRSLALWNELFASSGEPLFIETGVLWLARAGDPLTSETVATLRRVGVRFDQLARAELAQRYPQIGLDGIDWGVLEPGSGVLLARRAVRTVVDEAVRLGAEFALGRIGRPEGSGRLAAVRTDDGREIRANTFVFACGPWLPKIFPDVIGARIQPTRQEVLCFGGPPGDPRFTPPAMPAWVDFEAETYGVPDLESRGFKVGLDRHGPPFDPDTGDRTLSAEGLARARAFLARRFPRLADAPLVESRVCQYENTSNGDFLIDRHPDFDNVWLVGGGSGHGFKHGPAVGEHVAALIEGTATVEPRFALASKGTARERAVY